MTYAADGFDRRRAAWMPSPNRDETFEAMRRLAAEGLSRRKIAERLGASDNALSCYMRRQGITMAELMDKRPDDPIL